MLKITIEKNIPIPAAKPNSSKLYPLNTLELNDSFCLQLKDTNFGTLKKLKTSIANAASMRMWYGTRKKFTYRVVCKDISSEAIRVWRIK